MSLEFVVCVCGGRDFTNRYEINKALSKIHNETPIDLLIHGNARGADKLSGAWAKSRNIPVREVPAQWNLYGNRAGLIRNLEMIKMKPDLVIAFPGGNGTTHMVESSLKMV